MSEQQLTIDQLQAILSQTLSHNSAIRRAAEDNLNRAQKVSSHPLTVLRLVASSDIADPAIRQAAAVHFKNIVKKGWDTDAEDGNDGIDISDHDRTLIKQHLVELMCTVPHQLQAQCSEAISLIAAVDFPSKWDNLLPELVQKFNAPNPDVVNGVLLTANSIFKRFRYQQRSDSLYADIIYVLEKIQAPLLTLFRSTGQAVEAYANDKIQLRPRITALRTMCRIFFSLNFQDLPEYFEDHMSEWMEEFSKYLNYNNPLLTDKNEEDEPSPIDDLQAAIVENLHEYASKDEETFIPFLPNFTKLVWNLLLGVSSHSKHDILATTCIKFLSSLIEKLMHRNLFQDESTLRQIVSKIVIPNLMIREIDMEQFEDDPQEFINGDIEGNDTVSRRKRSQNLLRAMCRQFDTETTTICSEHITSMLSEFTAAQTSKWSAKDAAIHLFLGISIKAESAQGVSEVNQRVDVLDFFTNYILPELQDTNHSVRPMVKATAIKFVSTYRNQFSKEHMTALMPHLITHLASPNVVVHTYSAIAIEKFLRCKIDVNQVQLRCKFGSTELKPFVESLLTGLFAIVDNAEWNENEYVMKCIMRALNTAKDDVMGITTIVLEKLNAALVVVAKNPRNPQYNHYLFESIAVLVKSVCSKHPEHTIGFEGLLFPPFESVLQLDVSEFTPYVFQILAQLLEYRVADLGLGDSYKALFPPLLTPSLWERKGNIPALTRLLQAYLQKGAAEIVSSGQFSGLLGVFQKLVATRSTEGDAFALLGAITQFIPVETLTPQMKSVFQILLLRLQHGKTVRYVRYLTSYIAQYVGKNGCQQTFEIWNEIQPNLGHMLLSQVWLPQINTDLPTHLEGKIHIVALTKIICDYPALLASDKQVWAQCLTSILKILTSQSSSFDGSNDPSEKEVVIGYDAKYSRLSFATKPIADPFEEIRDAPTVFVNALHQISVAQPTVVPPILELGIHSDPKLFNALNVMLQNNGLQ